MSKEVVSTEEWFFNLQPTERSKVKRTFMHQFGKNSVTFYNKVRDLVRVFPNEQLFFETLKQPKQ